MVCPGKERKEWIRTLWPLGDNLESRGWGFLGENWLDGNWWTTPQIRGVGQEVRSGEKGILRVSVSL